MTLLGAYLGISLFQINGVKDLNKRIKVWALFLFEGLIFEAILVRSPLNDSALTWNSDRFVL